MGFRVGSTAVVSLLILATACASPPVRTPRVPAHPPIERPPDSAPPPRTSPVEPPSRIDLARALLGRSYRYGGATPSGFDCSGLVLYVLERDGVRVPRTTREQARFGAWVPLDELEAGDLVFFGEAPGGVPSEPHHVGIVTSGGGEPLRMIHASTSWGVVETAVFESDYWLRRLRFGRRVKPGSQGF